VSFVIWVRRSNGTEMGRSSDEMEFERRWFSDSD
jgi:hypothetical protein